jgi:hypothetical protein
MKTSNNKKVFAIIVIILLITIFILNVVDYFQTIQAIQAVGLGIEANPIARYLFQNNLALIMKLIIMPLVLALMGFVIICLENRLVWSVYFLLVLYIWVVTHNFIVLIQLGLL